MRRVIATMSLAAVAAVSGAAGATPPPTIREVLTDRVERAIEAHGLDPAAFLDAPAVVTVSRAEGEVYSFAVPMREALERIAPPVTVASGDAPGIAGTPEIVAGNLTHVYADFRSGTSGGYKVKTSSTFPDTPAVPVILPPPSPAPFPAYSAGGPMRNIRGTHNVLGVHLAGTLIGSNVDTAQGPSPFPVWVPVATSGIVGDASIDFAGHAVYVATQSCFFGLCLSAGSIVFGDGIAIFDNHAIASGVPTVGLPDLP